MIVRSTLENKGWDGQHVRNAKYDTGVINLSHFWTRPRENRHGGCNRRGYQPMLEDCAKASQQAAILRRGSPHTLSYLMTGAFVLQAPWKRAGPCPVVLSLSSRCCSSFLVLFRDVRCRCCVGCGTHLPPCFAGPVRRAFQARRTFLAKNVPCEERSLELNLSI